MGHFVDVFLFNCFNRRRYSIDPKIQLSVSFLRDGNCTFNVFSEIKWWMVPFISSREENSLPAELCSLLAAGNISRVGHGLQLETSAVVRIGGGSFFSLILWLSLYMRPNSQQKGVFTSILAKQVQIQVLTSLSRDLDHYENDGSISPVQSLKLWFLSQPKAKGFRV